MGVTPIISWMLYLMENPTRMDENWGYPYFGKAPNVNPGETSRVRIDDEDDLGLMRICFERSKSVSYHDSEGNPYNLSMNWVTHRIHL